MGLPDHLTCYLRNLPVGQEARELDMEQQTGSKLGKEYVEAVYCHTAKLTYICRGHHENGGLDEAHTGIKIAGRNINNFRYVDDTTLTSESEEEPKSLLMNVKAE